MKNKYIKLFISEGYEHRGDEVYQKGDKMIVLGKDYIRFCNFTKKEVIESIKKHNIQRVIDEDNNNGLVQSIWSLYHLEPEYKIKLCEKTKYDNHSTDCTIMAIKGILNCIKRGETTVDEYLSLISK